MKLAAQNPEKHLTTLREHLVALVDHLPLAVILCQPPDGRVYYTNARAQELFASIQGLGPEWVVNLENARFAVAGGRAAGGLTPVPTALRGERFPQTDILVDAGNATYCLSLSAFPLLDSQGAVACAVVVLEDVTRQRRVESRLEHSQKLLANAQRIAKLGSWESFPARGVLSWSDQVYEIFGVSRESFLPTYESFLKLVAPNDRGPLLEAQSKVIAGQTDLDLEHRIIRPDGSERVIHERGELRIDETTGERCIIGTALDITDLHRAYDEVRASESRYRLLFEHNPQPMWVYDETTLRVLAANPAALAFYGYSIDEFLSMTIAELRPVEDRGNFRLHPAPASGPHYAGVRRHSTKSGRIVFVEIRSHGIQFDGRKARLAQATDVTDRQLLAEQLHKVQRLEAVGQLAGGIAHDFNNLLTVINGYSSLLLARLSEDAEFYSEIAQIREAGQRAANLTQQLLAFSRRQVLKPRPLNLNTIVSGIRPMVSRLLRENVELTIDLGADLRTVMADPTQMEQVLMNLIINASDATQEGGHVSVQTSNIHITSEESRSLVNVTPGDYVVITVADDGLGMPPEVQARVFEPFFTTKKGRGSGLGLPTVHGIVHQSGGHIHLRTGPGEGAVFRVFLPAVDIPAIEPDPVEPVRMTARGRETVLLVEDDEDVGKFAATVLELHGYTVLRAPEPHAALSLAEQHSGPIQLIITDMVLPRMNGRDLAQRLLQEHPESKVLLISGYTDDPLVHQSALGEMHFLPKPFTPQALVTKIRELLDSGRANT